MRRIPFDPGFSRLLPVIGLLSVCTLVCTLISTLISTLIGCGGGKETVVVPEVTHAEPSTVRLSPDWKGEYPVSISGKDLKAGEPISVEITGEDGEIRERPPVGSKLFVFMDSLTVKIHWTTFMPQETRGSVRIRVFSMGREIKGSPVAFTVTQ